MSDSVDRRTVLKGVAATAAAIGPVAEALGAGPDGLQFEAPVPFSYDLFRSQARDRAQAPYQPPPRPSPEVLAKINYEEWGKIKYRDAFALFADGPGPFPITFFHLGLFFQKAVGMHVVEGDHSRKIIYQQAYFDMPANSPAHDLPPGAGFAGLRIQEARGGALDWRHNDWVAFLGAAYFRSIGELRQYGLSARGIALDVAVADRPEEFPDFTEFYIDSSPDGQTLTLYALMEGPSIVGAYRFLMTRGAGVIMDIQSSLFVRAQVSRFGIAPITSMYWFSETKKETAIDWRPEVHDSDGLEMWSGNGERLWRALNNPPRIMVSSFLDDNPRGFGLMQRDRVFDHYLDGAAAWAGRAGVGQGLHPAVRDPDRRRDPRQCGGDVGPGLAGARGRRTPPQLQAFLVGQFARTDEPRPGGGDAARTGWSAGPTAAEGGAQVHGRVSGRPA
jgi:glucans biosynthesis protein